MIICVVLALAYCVFFDYFLFLMFFLKFLFLSIRQDIV